MLEVLQNSFPLVARVTESITPGEEKRKILVKCTAIGLQQILSNWFPGAFLLDINFFHQGEKKYLKVQVLELTRTAWVWTARVHVRVDCFQHSLHDAAGWALGCREPLRGLSVCAFWCLQWGWDQSHGAPGHNYFCFLPLSPPFLTPLLHSFYLFT